MGTQVGTFDEHRLLPVIVCSICCLFVPSLRCQQCLKSDVSCVSFGVCMANVRVEASVSSAAAGLCITTLYHQEALPT
jgi:hypothetical protein